MGRFTNKPEAKMSDLLNDSPTAVKFRDRILNELHPGEQVLYAADAQVTEPMGGTDFNLYIGSVIVTNERLLVTEGKMMGRVSFHSVPWIEVVKSGHLNDGKVGIQKTVSARSRWPLWEIGIWEGKSYKTPLDRKRLDLLSRSIQEARLAIAAADEADMDSAYDELKRRRGF
jgi:Bacterial PH domain